MKSLIAKIRWCGDRDSVITKAHRYEIKGQGVIVYQIQTTTPISEGPVENRYDWRYILDVSKFGGQTSPTYISQEEAVKAVATLLSGAVNEGIKKFDDVRIKSKNIAGIVYKIEGDTVIVKTLKKGLVKTTKADLEQMPKSEVIDMKNEASNFPKKFRLLSPDGFDMYPGKEYTDINKARKDFENWAKRFKAQGYYSSNRGRIDLRDLADEMVIEPVTENKFTNLIQSLIEEELITEAPGFAQSLSDAISEIRGVANAHLDDVKITKPLTDCIKIIQSVRGIINKKYK